MPNQATVNSADNTGTKILYIISAKGIKGPLNQLDSACVGDMVMATVMKGKPDACCHRQAEKAVVRSAERTESTSIFKVIHSFCSFIFYCRKTFSLSTVLFFRVS
ncbi:hypothetical protein SAY87_023695 [Trapa incisa]|uniref:Ribosomal protein L14 n=1 Tax=Trapa incisa TaxID=236973 RepID=A0AAN7L133_9MYRT|nr:hypothetical protein SAY87_023695 [Trapa incisa]